MTFWLATKMTCRQFGSQFRPISNAEIVLSDARVLIVLHAGSSVCFQGAY